MYEYKNVSLFCHKNIIFYNVFILGFELVAKEKEKQS